MFVNSVHRLYLWRYCHLSGGSQYPDVAEGETAEEEAADEADEDYDDVGEEFVAAPRHPRVHEGGGGAAGAEVARAEREPAGAALRGRGLHPAGLRHQLRPRQLQVAAGAAPVPAAGEA